MSLSGAVPKHATYIQGGLPVGLDSRRRTIRLVPQTGTGPYTPTGNNIIRLDIPNSIGFLDTQNSYLRFRVQIEKKTIDLNFPCYMDKNSMSWCERFEVISNNGSVLESIHDYNLLVNLLHKATSPDDYRLTTGKMIDNQGTKAERNANVFSLQGKQYCAGLDASGIFGGNTKYLPCQFIEGALTLEFSLAQFSDCFVGTPIAGVASSYIIKDVEYVAEAISFGQDFNYLFEQQLRTAGIDMAFHSYRSHHHSLQSGTDQVIQLSQNSKSVKGVYVVMRDTSKYRSTNYESLSNYKSGKIQQYQFDLGGRLFPEFPVSILNNGSAVAWASNCNSFNHFRDQSTGTSVTKDTFSPEGTNAVLSASGITSFNMPIVESYWGYLYSNSGATNHLGYGKPGIPLADDISYLGTKGLAGAANFIRESGLYWRPCDCRQLGDIKLGDRFKLNWGTSAKVAEDSALDRYYKSAGASNKVTGHRETDGTTQAGGSDGGFLFVTGVGVTIYRRQLQGIMKAIPGCVQLSRMIDGCASDQATTLGTRTLPAAGEEDLGKVTINMPPTMAVEVLPTLAYNVGARDATVTSVSNKGDNQTDALCYIQKVPDDTDYFIGQSFETHEEHESMISGMDTTNVVPLHINLKFSSTKNLATGVNPYFNSDIKQGDLLTAFLHYDAVLRIEPDGSVISSM